MPKGWVTSEDGYFGGEADGRDTLAALKTYRLSAEAWEKAVSDIKSDLRRQELSLQQKLDDLAASFNAERKAYRAEIEKARVNQIIYIILAGVGGYFTGHGR